MFQMNINPKLLHKSDVEDVLIFSNESPFPSFLNEEMIPHILKVDPEIVEIYSNCDLNLYNISFFKQSMSNSTASKIRYSIADEWNTHRGVPHQLMQKFLSNELHYDFSNPDIIDRYRTLCCIFAENRSISTNLINSGDHYFFYRKAHEHVPGTMLIESHRQSVYSLFYKIHSELFGHVTISLKSLNSNFFSYGDLMYPIELITDVLNQIDSISNNITYRTAFYQRGQLISLIDTNAATIKVNQLDEIRSIFIHRNEWFKPLICNLNTIKATIYMDEYQYQVSLQSISKNAAILNSNVDQSILSTNNNKKFVLIDVNGNEFSSQIINQINLECGAVQIFFDSSDKNQIINLSKIITRGFILDSHSS